MIRVPRRPLRLAGWILAAAFAIAAIEALVVEPHLRLTVTTLALPAGHDGRLGRALRGARVVHLSDMHVRGMGWRERRLARLLASSKPDLVLMTGDYGEGREGLAALTRILASVNPPLGIFGVPGNNDHFRGQRAAIGRALREGGAVMLVNRSARIAAPGGDVVIAGVDDPHFGRDRLEDALRDAGDADPLILLAHSPDLLAEGRGRGLLFNAGDEDGPWGRGWFWNDGSHLRGDPALVRFAAPGRSRLRVQRREDGVAVREIRLVPEGPGTLPATRRGRRGGPGPGNVAGQIVIDAADVLDGDLHGGWVREATEEGWALVDGPDRGVLQSYPEAAPGSYFEAGFQVEEAALYRVWVRFRSGNRRGTSDSLYVQFSDGLGVSGSPDNRIGNPGPAVDTKRVDLMLAGHTHGGQVILPWLGPVEPNIRQAPWLGGMYDVESMALHVSRGIGWSWFPARLLCPPEVVVLETTGE